MAQNQGDCVAGQCVLGLCWGDSSRLLHTTLLTLRSNDTSSPICRSPVSQLSPPLSLQFCLSPLLTTPFLHLSHLFISNLFVIIALEIDVLHNFFLSTQLSIQIFMATSHWSALRFWFLTSCKCWTIAETYLGYPVLPRTMVILRLDRPSEGRFCESFRLLHFSPLSLLDSLRLTRLSLCACKLQAPQLPHALCFPARWAAQAAVTGAPCWGLQVGLGLALFSNDIWSWGTCSSCHPSCS